MDETLASKIANEWLARFTQPVPWLHHVATLLERVIPDIDSNAWICTRRGDDRLVIVAGRGLWIARAVEDEEKGDFVGLTMERFDLTSERIWASLTQGYSEGATTWTWEFRVGDGPELRFDGKSADDPAVLFGARLTEALDP